MTPPPAAPRPRLAAEWPLLLPAAVTIAVVVAWTATGGGYESQPALGAPYEPDPWYLGALTLVALAGATAIGVGRVRLSHTTKLACAALAGYVAWSFLSMLWAHDRAAAFLGSDRALVYLAAFVAFAILPWGNRSARATLALYVAAIAAIAIVTAVKVATQTDPGGLYIAERLAYPLGYYNATAALFMTTAAIAIALAAQRAGPAPLRVLGLLVAALCLQLAALGQSRGWLYTAPIVLGLMLLLIPRRLRLLLFAALPAAATAAIEPVLLRVYARAAPGGVALPQPHLSQTLHSQGAHAAQAMLIADLALAVLASAIVVCDRRVRIGEAAARRLNRAAAIAAIVAALAAAVVGLLAVHGDPVGRVERAWHSFADAGATATASGYSRFSSLASNRADIWRVALHEFAAHPLTGIGQDNFATSYTRLRRTYEQPRWTHSIELRLLTHTGLIGALLFLAFLVSALLAALRGRGAGAERASAGILLLALVVWLVHGSIDWFWEYPALSVPALAFTAAAGALERTRAASLQPDRGRADRSQPKRGQPEAGKPPRGARRHPVRSGAIGWIVATLLWACALAAVAVPFVAARKLERAIAVWPRQPRLAYSEIRSASDLLPFDAQTYLLAGSIAIDREEYDRARSLFSEAQSHEDQAWITPFVLGLLDSEQGRLTAARPHLLRARRLNPREPAIEVALARLRSGHPLTFSEAQELLTQHITTPPA